MAHDDEFRKVAEDLRALGRSLARDFWQAAEQARRSGDPPGHVLRHGLRQMAGEARRGLRRSGFPPGPRAYRRFGEPRRWGPPPGYDGAASRPPAADGRERPWSPAGWSGRPGPAGLWDRPHRPPRPRPASTPPVRRRWDGTTVLGILVVLFGTAWLVGEVGAIRLPAEGVIAVGLMVLGLAVIITARTDWSLSRHVWPVWTGAVLLVVLAAISAAGGVTGTLNHLSFGNMNRVADPGGKVYGGFGTLNVNASSVPPGSTVTVSSAAGQTFVTTPPGVPVDLHARVLAGQVCVGGQPQASGLGADVSRRFGRGGTAPLVLRIDQLAGEIVVDGAGCGRR